MPWHRWYLFQFEGALRKQADKYNDVTIPYWHWGEEADLCAHQGGCRTLDEKSTIIANFGGAGTSKRCVTESEQFAVDFGVDGTITSSDTFVVGTTTECTDCGGTFGSSAQDPNTSDDDDNTGCVGAGTEGLGFAGNWVIPVMPTHPKKTCLNRSRSLSSAGIEGFTSAADMIETIMSNDEYGSYRGFKARLEGLPHANPHNLLGGHIRTFVLSL